MNPNEKSQLYSELTPKNIFTKATSEVNARFCQCFFLNESRISTAETVARFFGQRQFGRKPLYDRFLEHCVSASYSTGQDSRHEKRRLEVHVHGLQVLDEQFISKTGDTLIASHQKIAALLLAQIHISPFFEELIGL